MAHIIRTILAAAFLAGIFAAHPALAQKKGDGKVEILNSPPRKNVVIRQGNDTLIIRTSPGAADRIQKILDNNDGRVIIKNRNFTYYPYNYYPYFPNESAPYSFGYSLGRKND